MKIRKLCAQALFCILGMGLVFTASASGTGDRNYFFAGPTGAWVLTVEFPSSPGAPPPPPPFLETLTFHALGTVSETNTLLNSNSYNPAAGQGCRFVPPMTLELNCSGSDGFGSWRRTGRNTLSFVVVKYVYDGDNRHVGFLRVSGSKLRFTGDTIVQESADSLTEILFGTDLETAVAIPLGGANARGVRIR